MATNDLDNKSVAEADQQQNVIVWLVDDDETMIKGFHTLFAEEKKSHSKFTGVVLKAIKNFTEFEKELRAVESDVKPTPSIIFLDLKFRTTKQGYAALDMIKNHEKSEVRSIPTVMFSSSSEPTEIRKSYRKSANAFVEKGSDHYGAFSSTLTHWTQEATCP